MWPRLADLPVECAKVRDGGGGSGVELHLASLDVFGGGCLGCFWASPVEWSGAGLGGPHGVCELCRCFCSDLVTLVFFLLIRAAMECSKLSFAGLRAQKAQHS